MNRVSLCFTSDLKGVQDFILDHLFGRAIHLITRLEAFTLLDRVNKTTLGHLKDGDVVHLLTILIGAVAHNFDLREEGTPCLNHDSGVHIINDSGNFEGLTQIIGLLLSEDNTSESVEFTFGQRLKECHIEDITCTVVRHLELTSRFNLSALFALNMTQQSGVTMHSRSRHLGWPIKERVVPLG